MLTALDLYVGLCLPRALHSNEAWTTLLIIVTFLLDLVAEAIIRRISGHRDLIDLVDL